MNKKIDFWNVTGVMLVLLFMSSAIMAMTIVIILNYFLTPIIKIPDS